MDLKQLYEMGGDVHVSVRLEEHTELSRGYGESLTHSYGAQPDPQLWGTA